MSQVLYYSNYCNHCQKLLGLIGKSSVKDDVHYVCIDKRIKKDGCSFAILKNGQELMLPPGLSKVPALMLLSQNNKILVGDDAYRFLEPMVQAMTQDAIKESGEPNSWSFGPGFSSCVTSDSFSFYDQTFDELSTKGDGGLKQMHSYATLGFSEKIETPPDTYTPDKIGENDVSMENIQHQREAEIGR